MNRKYIHLLILLLLLTTPLYAYLDPGSGSMLLYALIGIGATLLYSLKNLYYTIIQKIIGKHDGVHTHIGDANIIFHSEGCAYWNLFKPVIDEFNTYTIPFVYCTPDSNDPAIAYKETHNLDNLTVKVFKNEMQLILFLNQVHADIIVSSTPQLDVYMLKRSKHVKHYIHLIHAPTDVFVYKKFAFDFYDSVLCSGPHQITHIRQYETQRNTKPKRLFETGLTYYDVLHDTIEKTSAEKRKMQTDTPTILFAPTWGAGSAITKYGWSIFEQLLQTPYTIIFRPHPQLMISQKDLIEPILEKLAAYPQCRIDTDTDSTQSMIQSDMLVSDISGFIYDYVFLQNKPVILLDTDITQQGYEGDGIIPYTDVFEYKIRENIATIIKDGAVAQLPHIIETTLQSKISAAHHTNIRDEYVYNFGVSGKVASKQIVSVYEELQEE